MTFNSPAGLLDKGYSVRRISPTGEETLFVGAGASAWSMTLVFTLAALLPVAYPLLLYKRLERRGELDGAS